ncbi:MAG: nickel-dependent lactate racemase [Verrucomicrobiota bacterium]
MITTLDYGQTGLDLDLTGLNATILRPRFIEGLSNEQASFQEAAASPIGSPPLKELVSPQETVAIAIPDITRALPSDRLLPWLFEELSHVPAENFTIIIGTGTHRGNTREELIGMVGQDVVDNYRIVNHNARNYDTMTKAGTSSFGYDVYFNKHYITADRRILMGFIEPHFMAGFSGGYKAVFPGVANLDAIMQYHSFANIAHPRSSWGLIENNPTQNHVRAAGSLLPVDFLINVTLNNKHEITRYFCGHPIEAHEEGCRFSKDTAMAGVEDKFPIVVTTNSGYPLDLNLYQSVKGMAAAHQIASKGGLIIAAGRCNDGFPEHGAFKDQLYRYASPDLILDSIKDPKFAEIDQWQTQKLIQILIDNRLQLYSELEPDSVRRAHIETIADIRYAIDAELEKLGDPQTPIALLPEGPMTIPYVK